MVMVRLVMASAVLTLLLAGCDPTGGQQPPDYGALQNNTRQAAARALGAAQLPVAPDGPATGYSRAAFGAVGWPNGPDGCSVRDEMLARDLTNVTRRGRCYITSGTLADPYSGQTVTGPASSDEIDHIVPLALAWRSGAAGWSPAQRAAFAVDPLELQTTTHTMNDAKGDRGPEAWAPVAADRCRYGRAFTAVMRKYGLTVTAARKSALDQMQATC